MAGDEREQPWQAISVPASMAPLVQDRAWGRNTVGESGAAVYRLYGAAGVSDLYLKHGRGAVAIDVADEMVRLRWLSRHVPVPIVRHFVAAPDEAWLLMTSLPGRTAYQILEVDVDGRAVTVDALARFLRRLHSIPVESCPFNSDHRLRLAEARERLDAGLVDVEGFNEEHDGWTAEEVWDEIVGALPCVSDPVVTHGDFSLDNILLDGDEVAGCIDVDRAGIADRFQDLAILWNCLGEFGPALQQRLFTTYGIAHPTRRSSAFTWASTSSFEAKPLTAAGHPQ